MTNEIAYAEGVVALARRLGVELPVEHTAEHKRWMKDSTAAREHGQMTFDPLCPLCAPEGTQHEDSR